jgi:hypothetical protein
MSIGPAAVRVEDGRHRAKEPEMRNLVVVNNLTLDEVMGRVMAERMAGSGSLVLGTGRRMFAEGVPSSRLRLVAAIPTTTGVLIATTSRPTAEAG